MKFALIAIVSLLIGYWIGGGQFGILEFLYELVWRNPLGETIHNAVLGLDDDRLTSLYGSFRIDFRYGIPSFLFGCVSAIILRSKFALLPVVFVAGIVARIWVPMAITIAKRFSRDEAFDYAVESLPQFTWDVTLIPACALGIGIARMTMLRRLPRWSIRGTGILVASIAVLLMFVFQRYEPLIPFAACGLTFFVSLGLLIQTDATFKQRPNHPMQPSGEVGCFEVDDQPSPPADQ